MSGKSRRLFDELEQVALSDIDSQSLPERVVSVPAQWSVHMDNYRTSVSIQGYWISEATAALVLEQLK